jgi:hypothetical protein
MDTVGIRPWGQAAEHRRGAEHAEGAAVLCQTEGTTLHFTHISYVRQMPCHFFFLQYTGSPDFSSSNNVFVHVIRLVRRSPNTPQGESGTPPSCSEPLDWISAHYANRATQIWDDLGMWNAVDECGPFATQLTVAASQTGTAHCSSIMAVTS